MGGGKFPTTPKIVGGGNCPVTRQIIPDLLVLLAKFYLHYNLVKSK